MVPLVLMGMGALFGLVGAMVLATKSEVADDFTELSESTPGPKGIYTPGAVGCGGLVALVMGIAFFVAGVVSVATGGLG